VKNAAAPPVSAGSPCTTVEDALEQIKTEFPAGLVQDLPSRAQLVETARLYGLCHDVGHGPFGHLFDQCWLEPEFEGITHEDVSVRIVRQELGPTIQDLPRGIAGELESGVDVELLASLLTSEEGDGQAGEPFWISALRQALHGPCSPDVMDFLMRDSLHCGTPEYGTIDIQRIFAHAFVDAERTKGLAFHCSVVPALQNFALARLSMYENVYFHRTARAADALLAELLPDTLRLMNVGNPLDSLEDYLYLDESTVLGEVISWRGSDHEPKRDTYRKWEPLLSRRELLKEAYAWRLTFRDLSEVEAFTLGDPKHLKQSIKDRITGHLPGDHKDVQFYVDVPGLDVRPVNPILERHPIGIFTPAREDPREGDVHPTSIPELLANLPVKYVACRVFCEAGDVAVVREAAERALATGGPPRLQSTTH